MIVYVNNRNVNDFTWSEVGQRIRDWRVGAELTQRALADKVGLSQPAIQAIESGRCNPQLNSLHLLAAALGRTTRDLISGSQAVARDARVQRLERILHSGHPLAIAAAEQGLTCGEALLGTPPKFQRTFGKSGRGLRRQLSKQESDRAKQFLEPPRAGQQAQEAPGRGGRLPGSEPY